jgi:hypothetical protein
MQTWILSDNNLENAPSSRCFSMLLWLWSSFPDVGLVAGTSKCTEARLTGDVTRPVAPQRPTNPRAEPKVPVEPDSEGSAR